MNTRLHICTLALLLAGCDIPGLGPDPRIALREADGKAIGGACRHALRGIEDCYQLNGKALKTAVFDGWREMDQYMRDNKLEGQAPTVVKIEKQEQEQESITPSKKSTEKLARSDKH